MKKVYFAGMAAMLVLGSCGDSDALDGITSDSDHLTEEIHDAVVSFGEGGASNGEEYFSGILSAVVEVDVKLREVTQLDNMDATDEEITKVLDATLKKIEDGTNAINLYKDKDWPQRAEFHDITIEWFNAVDGLVNNYLYDLSEPMSRPDDTWSTEELTFYDEYLVAYDEYLTLDERWVEFQYTYAAANDFEISGTIDEEAMVEEQLNADTH